jgi:hypothetical protein
MVAISSEKLKSIMTIEKDVEPYLLGLILGSDRSHCPFRMLREGNPNSHEVKEAVTDFTRMLYQKDLLSKLSLSLADKEAYKTIWYAFGYLGGQTINKHGNWLCSCSDRCH